LGLERVIERKNTVEVQVSEDGKVWHVKEIKPKPKKEK